MPGSTVLVGHGAAARSGGLDARNNGGKGGKPPLPHIDDITSVTADIDPHTPIETVLQTAETYLRQAESSKNFGRPDFALKDYIRASLILVNHVKRNKGWASLQTDKKAQYERYQRLLKQIDAAHGDFAAIKAEIKADNARTGVMPTAGVNGHGSGVNGVPPTKTSSLPPSSPSSPKPRTKPIVHPKPQNLLGNALHPVGGGGSRASQAQQLAERFANLRVNSTQVSQRQTAQLAMSPTKLSDNTPFVELPKVPDAIYNPPRGTVSNEAAQLPSSTPNMFSRTFPAVPAPLNVTKGITQPTANTELFVPAQALGAEEIETLNRVMDQTREHITLDEFERALEEGTVLVIDIRNREDFDQGHIMCRAPVVCIEPEVLARPEISANQIADSMVLAPANEQLFFENRHAFRQIVFYDQNSTSVNAIPKTPQEKAINGLFVALEFYDFPTRYMPQQEQGQQKQQQRLEPRPPARLLSGGFDAWVKAGNPVASSFTKITHRYGASQSPKTYSNQRHKWVPRPLQDAAEVKRWEDLAINRTYEDFFTRYPPVSDLRESMTSPVTGMKRPAVSLPPVRPPPALPRRSYTGLADADDVAGAMKVARRPTETLLRAGIHNPGNWCYSNSLLQALFATWGFGTEVGSGQWSTMYKVPRKANEQIQGQLMMKFLQRVFMELESKLYPVVFPTTFMDYLQNYTRAVDPSRPPQNIFGSNFQQDAEEFWGFLLTVLDDETNLLRDRGPVAEKDYTPADGNYIANAIDYWSRWSSCHKSIIDKYFRGLTVNTLRCRSADCGAETRRFQVFNTLSVTVQGAENPSTLSQLLTRQQATYATQATCEKCNKGSIKLGAQKLARLPDRLAICLTRFAWNHEQATTTKLDTTITFPFVGLDLTQFMVQPDVENAANVDHHFAGRFIYDVYAVTVHIGTTANSGHYITYVRQVESQSAHDWIKLNDSRVDRVRVGSPSPRPVNDVTDEIFSTRGSNSGAYMIFLRRRDYA